MIFSAIINIMQNQQVKDKIEQIWSSIKMSRAGQLEQHLQLAREKVTEIIGGNQIQKLRHSSLLKLLVYELIICLDEKTAMSSSEKTIRKPQDSNRSREKSMKPLTRLNEIKELVCTMSSGRSNEKDLLVDVGSFRILLQKVRALQRDLLKEEEEKKRAELSNDSDSEGANIMIEQLEEIVKRKENRINELYCQLEENFNDKQQLEEEIQALEIKNSEVMERLKEVEECLALANIKCKEWETKYTHLSEEFEQHKHKEKEELLFGVTSFMQNEKPIKRVDNHAEDTTVQDDPLAINHQPITNSTKVLYRYCLPSITINEKAPPDEKTVKKKPFKMIESQCESEEEEDLLISVKPRQQRQQRTLQNENHTLQRMLLMQALFIEKALQDILG